MCVVLCELVLCVPVLYVHLLCVQYVHVCEAEKFLVSYE